MEGAAVYKLPNPWLLCSKLQAKGSTEEPETPGATEPMLLSHWAAQLGKSGSKGQSAGTGPGLTFPGDHIQNRKISHHDSSELLLLFLPCSAAR